MGGGRRLPNVEQGLLFHATTLPVATVRVKRLLDVMALTCWTAAMEFKEFAKIPRLFRGVVVTEKIDGTNGLVYVTDDLQVHAGSRSRWITPEQDNAGFARWVAEHSEELKLLGPGYHYGEWWGQGIQRRYGLTEKRFSLFNVHRWSDESGARPACCHLVPVIGRGVDVSEVAKQGLATLKEFGSVAAPGFMNPEGVVLYHTAGQVLFKATIDKDEEWKGKQ